MLGSNDKTIVKETTKIKEKYHTPSSGLNPPTQNLNTGLTTTTGMNPSLSQPMTQPLTQPIIQPLSQPSTQFSQNTSIPMGSNVTSMPISTNLPRNRSSSSSSSSSSQRQRNLSGSNMGNINPLGQPTTLNQPIQPPVGNITTGYGPTTTFDTNLPTSNVQYGSSIGSNLPLGKNLYGETGYATQAYQVQQPFPGQTVYVEKPSQKISKKTKQKFEGNIM